MKLLLYYNKTSTILHINGIVTVFMPTLSLKLPGESSTMAHNKAIQYPTRLTRCSENYGTKQPYLRVVQVQLVKALRDLEHAVHEIRLK